MADIEKKTKRLPADLTEEEWVRVEQFPPGAAKTGRQGGHRVARSAERDPLYSAFGWRLAHAAKRFSAPATVYRWFRRFVRSFMFEMIQDVVADARPGAVRLRGEPRTEKEVTLPHECASKGRITSGGRFHPENCRLIWKLTSRSAG